MDAGVEHIKNPAKARRVSIKGLFKAIVHTDWRRIAECLSEVSLHPILWLKIKLLE
jgi:hypothetical protein